MEACSKLIGDVRTSLNNRDHVRILYLDLRNVFDSLDHSILLFTLHSHRTRDIQWKFKSYLLHRQQRVYVNGCMSEFQPISYGVPQGSCLGPLLLLIFISFRFIDADDTAVMISNASFETLHEELKVMTDGLNSCFQT